MGQDLVHPYIQSTIVLGEILVEGNALLAQWEGPS